MSPYTASRSLPPGRNVWVLTFRHPLKKDAKGKFGLKIRKSLATQNAEDAERLVIEMNELLSDTNFHNPLKRSEAERKFNEIVVSAFYDAIEAPAADPVLIREQHIPMPQDVPEVLFVGPTGSGKTSLLRHIIGSDPRADRFPSTSTARTTTSDIEVIMCPGDSTFRAVVTFRSQWEVIASVSECISNACLAAFRRLPDSKVAERLLHHPDQTFRLNYILGSYETASPETSDDWRYEGEESDIEPESLEEEDSVTPEQREQFSSFIRGTINKIENLASLGRKQAEKESERKLKELSPAERDVAEQSFLEWAEDQPEFDNVTDEVIEQILVRFSNAPEGTLTRKSGGWPESWSSKWSARKRDEFIPDVRWFSSNYAPAFGTLITPLVQGIRVRGPFASRFTTEKSDLILVDGQGVGHTPESTASVSTHITRRYSEAHAIVLVDNAEQPMLPGSLSVLKSVITSGYQRKLAIAFTHADCVKGPNLLDFKARRAHVMRPAAAILNNLREVLGPASVESVERDLEERCFMLAWLDRPISQKSKALAAELRRLLSFCRDSILPESVTHAVPIYEPTGLLFAVQSADSQFQELWNARLGFIVVETIKRRHWASIKALNRRVAMGIDNSEYVDLRPAAELIERLSETIGRFLDAPISWRGPNDRLQRESAIAKVRQTVSAALHEFVEEQLLSSQKSDWVKAFELYGTGSTSVRAQIIKDIVEEAAPIPNEALNREIADFLNELRSKVYRAIMDGGGRLTFIEPDDSSSAVA